VKLKREREADRRSWLDGVDIGQPGSRFTDRVALAIVTREGIDYPAGGGGDAKAIVARVLKDVPKEETSTLGKRTAVDGSIGRGASGWVAVLEFALEASAGGVIAGAAWQGAKRAARELRDLLSRLRDDDVHFFVSRGAAALVAIEYVVELGEEGVLDIEAVTDSLAMAGRGPTELSYVGVEPWLVSLVNETRTERHIVAVSPRGNVLGAMRFRMSESESMYGVLPSRDE
jgi:hypothetical protein